MIIARSDCLQSPIPPLSLPLSVVPLCRLYVRYRYHVSYYWLIFGFGRRAAAGAEQGFMTYMYDSSTTVIRRVRCLEGREKFKMFHNYASRWKSKSCLCSKF